MATIGSFKPKDVAALVSAASKLPGVTLVSIGGAGTAIINTGSGELTVVGPQTDAILELAKAQNDAPGPQPPNPPDPTPPPSGSMKIGGNVAAVEYYGEQRALRNIFNTVSKWLTTSPSLNEWDTGEGSQMPVDSNGYPLEVPFSVGGNQRVPHALMLRELKSYPSGKYVCLYDGDGDLTFRFNAKVSSHSAGRYDLDVTPSRDGVDIVITRSSKANPVKNIRLYRGDVANVASNYDPTFMARVKPFGVLRFMDFTQTNDSPSNRWSQRKLPSYFAQAGDAGAAWEHVIGICNELGAHPWINVPHMADDGYLAGLASLFAANLDSKLKVYIEWSNEVWNGQFGQCDYAQTQGMNAGLDKIGNYPGQRYWAGIKYQARRSAQVFSAFASKLPAARMVRVLAGQAGSGGGDVCRVLAESFEDPQINPAGGKYDALAIAPYFGNNIGGTLSASSDVNAAIQACFAAIAAQTGPDTAANAAIAKKHGVPLIAYEGGQHVYAKDTSNNGQVAKIIELNEHPQMRAVYKAMFDAWFGNGGSLFVHYTTIFRPGPYGCWGALETQTQPESQAPKYQGLLDALAR